MKRKPDWPAALDMYLRAAAARPFAYGEHDCCLFVAGAVEAITGVDMAQGFRGLYRSRKAACRTLADHTGIGRLAAAVPRLLAGFGMTEVDPKRAQRGDVILLARPGDASLALVSLSGEFLAAADPGYRAAPRELASRAWRT